ncbi:hypothetical protein ACO1O0_009337 [Amphichorda felina]
MAQSTNPEAGSPSAKKPRLDKSHDILTCTVKAPQFSYAHMQLVTDGTGSNPGTLDELQVKSYCTVALRQFLGITGAAIPLDVLKAEGTECWVRVPREDLGPFAAAMTAWRGTTEDGVQCLLRLKQCSDWLGAMVGSDGQDRLWNS